MTVSELPRNPGEQTRHQRWIPTRAGILNIWRYYDETFDFHNGRLLLRGPNGTGKSKALELLLPFLFDANLRAHRLSTFGSSERTMHWNMMGEGTTGKTRVGYVWLEFQGAHGWFCCGARLQASAHTSNVHADYFTTSQRIGTPGGLRLVNDSGQPLTRAALAESIGEHGDVHPTAADYRATVRTTLFGDLSEQRYDALITALLQLRTPKLSERLDPALLSTLLSRALPPLGHAEIAELAEGFERLDRQREQLAKLDAEVEAAETVAARQRGYAQRVLRASAASVISATSEMDKLARTARESEESYQAAVREKAAADERKQQLSDIVADARARIDGLTDSEAYKKGRELDRLRQETAGARRQFEQARERADAKRRTADEDAQTAREAQQRVDQSLPAVQEAESDTSAAARRAGLETTYHEVAAMVSGEPQEHRARQILRSGVTSRLKQIADVRRALGEWENAVTARKNAEQHIEHARSDLAAAISERESASGRYEAELAELAGLLRRWARSCAEIVIADPDALADAVASESQLREIVDAARHQAVQAITSLETSAKNERQSREDERSGLDAEIERLRGETDLPPQPPPHRTTDRAAMPGSPLWNLVSFASGVPAEARTGIEAALQASGLLDAWVLPSGTVEVAGHDTFAEADLAGEVTGRCLLDVLEVEQDSPVPAERVRRLLGGIAYGETLPRDAVAAVAADGSWRLAAATGSWSKEHVSHIGAHARELARQRRIAELLEQRNTVSTWIEEIDARLRELDRRWHTLEAERGSLPGRQGVAAAQRELDRAESHVAARGDAVDRAVKAKEDAEVRVNGTLRALTALASQTGLPSDRPALDQLDTAVSGLRDVGDRWLDLHHKLASVRAHAEAKREQADRSESAAAEAGETAGEIEAKWRQLASTLEAVESAVSADYRDVLAEIDRRRGELHDAQAETKMLDSTLLRLAERIGSLNNQREVDARNRDDAVVQRDTASSRFRELAAGSLPTDAAVELARPDATRAALEAAREVAAKWPSIPHSPKNLTDALGRLTEAVHSCSQVLADRADLSLETDQDVQVFRATVDGIRVGAAELLRTVTAERDRSHSDITAAERELFDKTLTGNTRRHLAARIRQANELVDAMNARLERVRTASNVSVRLVWQVDPTLPAGTREARSLLLKDPVRLTDHDRDALHRFFRDRIEEAKAANTATSWEQQLAQVFDYTAWHQFVVKIDRGSGHGWQLLTKKLHGALSGGEKAIALHLPLFAAVAAHYETVRSAPRLILLDEVFVGVDAINRGQVFDLLSTLDLDLVLTSDHEWCTYSELDGIAIHQLITGSDSDDAVTTARFVWNGVSLEAR